MEVVGYCEIKKDATTCKGTEKPENYIGKLCRVMEFDQWGGVLVLNSAATGLAMFDACDVHRKFECKVAGEYLLPPGLNPIAEMEYMHRLMTRKGGYNTIVRQMVIGASLLKGKYNDDFLFQIEREDRMRSKERRKRVMKKLSNLKRRMPSKKKRKAYYNNVVLIA